MGAHHLVNVIKSLARRFTRRRYHCDTSKAPPASASFALGRHFVQDKNKKRDRANVDARSLELGRRQKITCGGCRVQLPAWRATIDFSRFA